MSETGVDLEGGRTRKAVRGGAYGLPGNAEEENTRRCYASLGSEAGAVGSK